ALTYSGTTTQNPTSQVVTLQNTNNQPLDWSSAVSTGDGSNWLSISPASDHLAAHSSETVTVNVQTLQLAIGSYQGTINFKGGTNPEVTVALSVAAPGNVVASPPSLSFTSIGQNPAAQTITMQNSGEWPLDWSATTATVDKGNWLLLSPSSGHLEAGQSGNVAVTINASGLKPQSYQGTLTFTYDGGLTKSVPIALTVSVPPAAAISLSPGTMNFSTLAGTNPGSQAFTITNTGNATLNWAIAEDQNGATFAPLSATSGSLAPTKSSAITVNPTIGQSGAGVLTTNITVFDRDTGSKVLGQKIAVTITIKDQPMISLSMGTMSFSQDSTITESSQLLVITNTGSQTLNWAAQSSASWLSADVTSGVLAPGASATLDVHCDSSALPVGNVQATFVVSDSDAGTTVTPQTLTVSLTVS
ncbi:MAG: choice-of-anchor D domain-containing protein, partial [Ktedonobacteraceae bacterium]